MDLTTWGWSPVYAQHLTLEDYESSAVARVVAIHRTGHVVATDSRQAQIPLGGAWYQQPTEERPTVGDFVLVDHSFTRIERVIPRKSVFKRVAAGTKFDVQLIGANVDTVFVVTSCNEEFNANRLQRYLTLARDASVEPVVVLTKADLSDNAEEYVDLARRVSGDAVIEPVNALAEDDVARLMEWVRSGDTLALLGSSGVGKSTLLNTLAGEELQDTGGTMADDRGRHTTTHRSLHQLQNGAIVLDVPGMRELGLVALEEGLDELYDDIEAIAATCRFSDCQHETEPGCAIQAAIDDGRLEEERLNAYYKMQREERRHTESLAEQHHRSRQFGKRVKSMMKQREKMFPGRH